MAENDPNAKLADPNKVRFERTIADSEPPLAVTLTQTETPPTADQPLWVAIRNRTRAISFERYNTFINDLLCNEKDQRSKKEIKTEIDQKISEEDNTREAQGYENKSTFPAQCEGDDASWLDSRLSIHAADSYSVLRLATEAFLLLECGVVILDEQLNGKSLFSCQDEINRLGSKDDCHDPSAVLRDLQTKLETYLGTSGSRQLPYLRRILKTLLGEDSGKLSYCDSVLSCRTTCPSMLELIWSYWHEEAMQVQSINAIAMRFQNRRGPGDRDPLANMEMSPLRPLSNLLWGYIQNEQNRLSISRRAYEYDHHYGITLYGKAVPQLRSADSRSKFLEGFHNLLSQTVKFYKQDADATVRADGFPLLNALKEVHLSLAEGAHNQYGDLPWTARVEMLIEQWLLARPEMREFLRGRYSIPYREEWMGTVDAMKKVQGWSDVTVTHFNELAMYGEQLLLSLRYGDWSDVNDENHAKNWARYWKPEIQSYIHSYRAVTEVDLTSDPVDSTPPWVHLKRKEQQKKGARR